MAQATPWIQLMSQQAQAISPRSEMEEGSAPVPPNRMMSSPDMDEEEALMLMKQGAFDNVLKKPGAVKSIEKTVKVSSRGRAPSEDFAQGPMSQAPVSYDQMMRDMATQYGVKSQEALAGQQQGIKQLEDNINQTRNAPRGIDYTPFVAMSKFLSPETDTKDSMTAAQSMKPQTAEEAQDKLLNLQNMLQQRKENMSKQQLDALKEQINAYKASKTDPLDTMLKTAKIGFYGNGRQALQTDRIDEQNHRGILSNLEHNKPLQLKLNQIQGIDNAGKIIEEAPVVTPEIFHDYQQALVSAVNRGNSGIAERAERYMKSAGIDAAHARQYITGQPVAIPGGKENLYYKVMQEFARSERKNIERQYNEIAEASAAGQGHTYERRADLKKDLMHKLSSMKAQTDLSSEGSGGPALDADLSKLSPAELDAWMKAHGG